MNDPARDLVAFMAAHAVELSPVDIQRGFEALAEMLDAMDEAITDGIDTSPEREQNRLDWVKQKEAIDGKR
jgi:hypothetical protein